MGLDLAAPTDLRARLNFNERTDGCVVADPTPVEVHEVRLEDPHVPTQDHGIGDWHGTFLGWTEGEVVRTQDGSAHKFGPGQGPRSRD
jgi:hypothetical protein